MYLHFVQVGIPVIVLVCFALLIRTGGNKIVTRERSPSRNRDSSGHRKKMRNKNSRQHAYIILTS